MSPPESTEPGPGGGDEAKLTKLLSGTVAVFVAALAAVGVTGDILTRAVRNYPILISVLLITTIVATLGFFTASNNSRRSPDRQRVIKLRYLLIIITATSATIIAGALSVALREHPGIALQADYADGQVTLTVESKAAGLSTTDQLSVQVLGLSRFSVIDQTTAEICEQIYAHSIKAGNGEKLQDFLNTRYQTYVGSVSLLLQERLGPDSAGNINSTTKLDFPAGLYQGVCAFSPLASEQLESARNSASYLRLSNCNETAIQNPTPPSSIATSVHSDPAPAPPAAVTVTTTASPSWAWDQSSNCSTALVGSSVIDSTAASP